MRNWSFLIFVSLFVGVTATLAQDVRYNYDSKTDFSKFKTYKWVTLEKSDHPDPLVAKQIADAPDAELAKKGLKRVDADPADLYVAFQTAIGTEKRLKLYSTGWGYGPGWYRGAWYGSMGTAPTQAQTPPGVPVFEITPVESSIKFDVDASVAIKGTFDKWDATLTFASPDVSTGVLEIRIQAASVDTGSGMKNGKLKGKDFFDVDHNPFITFKSTKIEQTGPDTFAVDGDFTIRGVTRHEKLALTVSGKGTGSGTIVGTMAFDRKEYGMNSGIPFIKIADRVEVSVSLKGRRISGPPLALK
jgi:polyisoprenoid-binding protein YceI